MSCRGYLILPLLALAAIFTDSRPAKAFCIENRADEALTFIIDVDGQGNNAPYVRRLAPGEEGCCDWQRHDCNASGKPDGVLKFSVTRVLGNQEQTCFGNFEASDEFFFKARQGSSRCDWGLTRNRSGIQLWNHFKDRFSRMVDWLVERWWS